MADLRKKLLFIEDKPESSSVLAEELIARGFEVFVTSSGQEGISAIQRWEPDLVICDINMPLMSGLEVLERLTVMAPQYGDLPFVLLTGRTSRHDAPRGRQFGAEDCITKPVDFE